MIIFPPGPELALETRKSQASAIVERVLQATNGSKAALPDRPGELPGQREDIFNPDIIDWLLEERKSYQPLLWAILS